MDTAVYTVYSRYNYLHCLQQIQLSTLSTVGTTIHTVYGGYSCLHCLQQIQLSTLSTADTTIYTVYSRYNYLHCLQQIQLSTLSTFGKALIKYVHRKMRFCWLFYLYLFLSSLLSFLFLFLFLSIYLLRFWYLSQSERPLDLHILFASSLPLHNKREFIAHFAEGLIRKVFIKQPNSRERARAEEIEAKFFFFSSLLCSIFFVFFPINFWISFTAL